jgi:uncharacterized protein YbjT (DUF2867 family)
LARALIVGCGCRGRELGSALVVQGWQVRGTSRTPAGLDAISAAGLEAAEADPDRPATILDLCGDIAVVVWLLGSVAGEQDAIAAIHGPRLERLLEKLVDTPVRGFGYEVAGSVDRDLLDGGRRIVERAGETWRIPIAFLTSDRDGLGWPAMSAGAVADLLA